MNLGSQNFWLNIKKGQKSVREIELERKAWKLGSSKSGFQHRFLNFSSFLFALKHLVWTILNFMIVWGVKKMCRRDQKELSRKLKKIPQISTRPGALRKVQGSSRSLWDFEWRPKRAAYDQYGAAGANGSFGGAGGFSGFNGAGGFGGFEDIFSSFFGRGGASRNQMLLVEVISSIV